MITQELIDYVHTQLSRGIAREKISSDLLGHGSWTVEQINEVFQRAASLQQVATPLPPNVKVTDVNVWERIRRYNKMTYILAVILASVAVLAVTNMRFVTGFGDLLRDPILGLFTWLMLGVLTLFSFFVWFENQYLSKKYANTNSESDKSVENIIRFRNLIFVLCVTPVLQIFGLLALTLTGWILIIVYVGLLRNRNKSTTSTIST